MGDKTSIAWCLNPDGSPGATWNPLVGCTAVSPGCAKCYAARLASTRLSKVPAYAGLAVRGKWTGEVRLLPERLDQPWRWRRPRGIFLCDMGDLFHPEVPDEYIARCFAIMQAAHWHTFYVLTKRADRLAQFTNDWDGEGCARVLAEQGPVLGGPQLKLNAGAPVWPPRNIVGGVTAEDDKHLALRVPDLLRAKLAMRFLSCEPMLGEIDFDKHPGWLERINWVVIGGENDVAARDFDIGAAARLVGQCQRTGTPVFLKQLGSRPMYYFPDNAGNEFELWPRHVTLQADGPLYTRPVGLRHRAGADPDEWAPYLRVQQMHPPVSTQEAK